MKLDELQSVQSRERQTDQLQQLRSTFYQEAGEFIAQLREERERAAERADDPFDAPEVNRLSDDIRTAEQTVEAIYERRVGKIVKMASLAAADMPTEEDGLTEEERTLFERMVEAIETNRQHVLDVVAGEAPTDDGGEPAPVNNEPSPADNESDSVPAADPEPVANDDTTSAPVETGVDAADIMGGGDGQSSAANEPDAGRTGSPTRDEPTPSATDSGPSDESTGRPAEEALSAINDGAGGRATDETAASETATAETAAAEPPAAEPDGGEQSAEVDRKTVRITDEVGEIFGVDQREYDLSTNDVVTLPADNADPLVDRDAAEPLE